MIQSAYGGTRIEGWSTPEGLAECQIEPHCDPDEDSPKQCTSHLYNAMIHPFIRFNIYGALWYQGSIYEFY